MLSDSSVTRNGTTATGRVIATSQNTYNGNQLISTYDFSKSGDSRTYSYTIYTKAQQINLAGQKKNFRSFTLKRDFVNGTWAYNRVIVPHQGGFGGIVSGIMKAIGKIVNVVFRVIFAIATLGASEYYKPLRRIMTEVTGAICRIYIGIIKFIMTIVVR